MTLTRAAEWLAAGEAAEAPASALRRVELAGHPVCLAHVDGGWAAFDDTCTHAACSLAGGELEGHTVTCPCHGSGFDIRTGEVLNPPALEPVAVHETRVVDGVLEVRLREAASARASVYAAAVASPADEVALAAIDLADLDRWVEGVPYHSFALMRRFAPVHWQDEPEGRGFWSFTRYDDIVAVSRDHGTYSSEVGGTSLQDLTPEEVELRKSMIDTDPPRHTRLRAIVNQGFTPRVVNAYEARIRGLAREILARAFRRDAFGGDTFDWVADVASEIPMWVFSEIMGLPLEDRRLLIDLGDRLLGNTDPELMGEEAVAERALRDAELRKLPFASPYAAELMAYGRRLGEARRREPRDDVTTRLVEAEVDGSRLTDREFETFFILLTTAGNETTRHTLTLGLIALLDHPAERARLVADPSLAGSAADELLRWAHPVHHFRRTATRTHEAHGQTIRAGDKVVVWYTSGNFDEARFRDPDRLDLGRKPNKHLTFGLGGPHFCLGAHLARLEVRIWLEEMVPYLDRIELAGPADRLRSNFFNGVKRLPVRVPRVKVAKLEERGVRVIRLLYTDLHGIARGKDIPISKFEGLAEEGVAFCAAVMSTDLRHTPVVGGEEGYVDFAVKPDFSTLRVVPWQPEVAWCIGDARLSDNSGPAATCARGLLARVTERYRAHGLAPAVGPELEFFLLERDPEARGGLRRYVDEFSRVYTVGPISDPRGIVLDMLLAREALELRAFAANHEFMNSQYEINVEHSDALDAADRAFLLKTAVKELAARQGMVATFMGKPFNDQGGSGFHVHLSLAREDGTNAFDETGDPHGLGVIRARFVAGLLEHGAALMALLAPTVNAYKRLVPDSLAPTHVNWALDNRTAFVRVPNEHGPRSRVEVRGGDGSAAPHLVVAALLLAGLDGIERELELGAPVSGDAYRAESGAALPRDLGTALDALEADVYLSSALGEGLVETFFAMKRFELDRFAQWVTDWEVDEYARHL